MDEQTRRMGAYIIETESQLENVDLSEIGVESGDCRHYSHRVRSAPDGDYYLAPTYSLQPRLLESTLNLILFAKHGSLRSICGIQNAVGRAPRRRVRGVQVGH